jgi:hypothetical protein
MLRVFLIAVAISMMAEALPASAQDGKGSCAEWCRINRCSGGMMSGAAPVCMNQCVAACKQKHKAK